MSSEESQETGGEGRNGPLTWSCPAGAARAQPVGGRGVRERLGGQEAGQPAQTRLLRRLSVKRGGKWGGSGNRVWRQRALAGSLWDSPERYLSREGMGSGRIIRDNRRCCAGVDVGGRGGTRVVEGKVGTVRGLEGVKKPSGWGRSQGSRPTSLFHFVGGHRGH